MLHDGDVLSAAMARALRDAGLQWTPARGDSFVMPDREMDSDVFVLADMTIEVHQFPAGPVIGFNGTTEWALDSVEQSQALWVPAEHQLRERLGDAFAGLAPTGDGYRVTLRVNGTTSGYEGRDPAEAYAQALLLPVDVAGQLSCNELGHCQPPGPPHPRSSGGCRWCREPARRLTP